MHSHHSQVLRDLASFSKHRKKTEIKGELDVDTAVSSEERVEKLCCSRLLLVMVVVASALNYDIGSSACAHTTHHPVAGNTILDY